LGEQFDALAPRDISMGDGGRYAAAFKGCALRVGHSGGTAKKGNRLRRFGATERAVPGEFSGGDGGRYAAAFRSCALRAGRSVYTAVIAA
jgi:hypothetical protein